MNHGHIQGDTERYWIYVNIHSAGHGNIHSEVHGHGNPKIDISPNIRSNPKLNSEKPHLSYFI